MAEQQTIAITDADHQSFETKWQTFVDDLTPAEQVVLEQRLAGEGGDVQGYIMKSTAKKAAAQPRKGSSAQPPR